MVVLAKVNYSHESIFSINSGYPELFRHASGLIRTSLLVNMSCLAKESAQERDQNTDQSGLKQAAWPRSIFDQNFSVKLHFL